MYAVPNPCLPARLIRFTRGSVLAISPTMAAVPSGELSSTTSTLRFAAWDNTNSTIERMFSFSLYVGMMTNARSFSATLFPLLYKPWIRQHNIGSLLKPDGPFLLLRSLNDFPDAPKSHGIHRINADWQLHLAAVGERPLL